MIVLGVIFLVPVIIAICFMLFIGVMEILMEVWYAFMEIKDNRRWERNEKNK